MNAKKVPTWNDFEAEVKSIFLAVRRLRERKRTYVSDPLFRGHAVDSWTLNTTPERFSPRAYAMNQYYDLLRVVHPTVSTLTSSTPVLAEWDQSKVEIPSPPSGYEFMVYLRHHGFPSPLLDWTRSPYVAAFFAFQNARRKEGSVAIFLFQEHLGDGKEGLSNEPAIVGCGPYVAGHRRHYVQQCEYTICKKREKGLWIYCNHEEALGKGVVAQNHLVKYLLPVTERDEVLEKLDLMNINAHSLFGSEEALMDTLAYREIEKQ